MRNAEATGTPPALSMADIDLDRVLELANAADSARGAYRAAEARVTREETAVRRAERKLKEIAQHQAAEQQAPPAFPPWVMRPGERVERPRTDWASRIAAAQTELEQAQASLDSARAAQRRAGADSQRHNSTAGNVAQALRAQGLDLRVLENFR